MSCLVIQQGRSCEQEENCCQYSLHPAVHWRSSEQDRPASDVEVKARARGNGGERKCSVLKHRVALPYDLVKTVIRLRYRACFWLGLGAPRFATRWTIPIHLSQRSVLLSRQVAGVPRLRAS